MIESQPSPMPQRQYFHLSKTCRISAHWPGFFAQFSEYILLCWGIFPAAMIGLVWAVFFDWSDGIIARRMQGRTDEQRTFGGQLDSLIDIVSFGICPAVVLLSYGQFSPWFIPGAFIIVAAGVIRLSYFNVFGLVGESTYMGLAFDNNGIILAFVFLFNGLVSQTAFTVILYVSLMVLAILNVASIRTPKLTGRWYYALSVYTVVLTMIYGWQLLHNPVGEALI